jgi:hypothetical protein
MPRRRLCCDTFSSQPTHQPVPQKQRQTPKDRRKAEAYWATSDVSVSCVQKGCLLAFIDFRNPGPLQSINTCLAAICCAISSHSQGRIVINRASTSILASSSNTKRADPESHSYYSSCWKALHLRLTLAICGSPVSRADGRKKLKTVSWVLARTPILHGGLRKLNTVLGRFWPPRGSTCTTLWIIYRCKV